jgi:hypothetical protein
LVSPPFHHCNQVATQRCEGPNFLGFSWAHLLTWMVHSPMNDNLDNLILDLLEWLGPARRPYLEVLDAWRTSCPRLPVWEEAKDRSFLELHHAPGQGRSVAVSPTGAAFLGSRRPQRGVLV